MELLISSTLLFVSFGLLAYQFSNNTLVKKAHFPPDIKGESEETKAFYFKELLDRTTAFTDRLIQKRDIPLNNLKRKLVSAGNPISISQFFAFRILMIGVLLALTYIIFQLFKLVPNPLLFIASAVAGFLVPDLWLSNKIKNRRLDISRNLPHISDLLNICVEGGLDFMIAVNRIIAEYRPCALIDELKIMMQEIRMGSTRREALKKLANRVNSAEVSSFVRTLLQADRMGTSIGEALKMQAEEIRIRRFQKGEEMALKAPVKLLLPLLLFILPVVLVIVAGPVLIQFTRGGFIKF